MEKALYLPTENSTTLFAVIGNPWALLGIWLVLINLVTFLVFGLDKWKARRKVRNETIRRVPEKTLFLLFVLGGSIGALLGMRIFHHKTRKWYFRFGIPLLLILQGAALCCFAAFAAGLFAPTTA